MVYFLTAFLAGFFARFFLLRGGFGLLRREQVLLRFGKSCLFFLQLTLELSDLRALLFPSASTALQIFLSFIAPPLLFFMIGVRNPAHPRTSCQLINDVGRRGCLIERSINTLLFFASKKLFYIINIIIILSLDITHVHSPSAGKRAFNASVN
jgi:hypothetical protein